MWSSACLRGEWFAGGAESDILDRARRAQRAQVEATTRNLASVVDAALEVMSATGMRRG
jgi:hypothetical protein